MSTGCFLRQSTSADVFEQWCHSQTRYRTEEDRERDAQLEKKSLGMPEIARMLGIHRKEVYAFVNAKENRGRFRSPIIGDLKLNGITTHVIEKYYRQLLTIEPVKPLYGKKKNEYLTLSTVRAVHKVLHSCFEQAVKWDLMEKNPNQQKV